MSDFEKAIILDRMLTIIKREAKREGWWDNGLDESYVDDFAGGNVDDAYDGGMTDGRIAFARELWGLKADFDM